MIKIIWSDDDGQYEAIVNGTDIESIREYFIGAGWYIQLLEII